jgi:lysophospholipid acyltransferase
LQIWSQKQLPSPYGGALRAFLQALLSMGLYTYLTPRFSVSRIFEPEYQSWGFWRRLGYQWLAGFTVRWKYYFIWSLAEVSVIISGFGFSGWSESHPQKPKWDRAKNVDIIGVELAESSAVLPLVWNIHVSTWLRLCILANQMYGLIVFNGILFCKK